jgi:hypothetical protein
MDTPSISLRVISNGVGDLEAGIAGEHLVCADLILQGCEAFMAGDGRSYDVVLDLGGKLLRIQVKSARHAKPIIPRQRDYLAYHYNPRRRGTAANRVLDQSEFDLLALVALDTGQIAYLPASEYRQMFYMRPDGAEAGKRANGGGVGRRFAHYPLRQALKSLRLASRLPQEPPISERSLGTVGEHLVCADLILSGLKAFRTDQSCAFDAVSHTGVSAPLRFQVKSTMGPRSVELPNIPRYFWHVGSNGRHHAPYPEGSFDLLALVAVDIRRVAYLIPPGKREAVYIRLTPPTRPTNYSFEKLTLQAALADLESGRT